MTKAERTKRISDALDRIAAQLPYGELLLATDQAGFFEAAAERLESLAAALPKEGEP